MSVSNLNFCMKKTDLIGENESPKKFNYVEERTIIGFGRSLLPNRT